VFVFFTTVREAYTNLVPIIRRHGGKVSIDELYDELKKELNARTIMEVPPERVEEMYHDIIVLIKAGIVECKEEVDPESLEEYNVLVLNKESAWKWERMLKALGLLG